MIIDRTQAEEMAWEGYVGNQTPEEFVAASREQGHETTEAAVSAYVASLDEPDDGTLFADSDQWVWDDLPDLLAGYIERQTTPA